MSAPYPNHNNHIYHGTPTDSGPRGQPASNTAHAPATSSFAPHQVLELASIDTRAPPGPVTDMHSRGAHGQAFVTPGQYLHNNTHAACSGPGNAAGGSPQPQAANGARMDTRAYAPPPLAASHQNVRMNQGPSTRGAVTTLPPPPDSTSTIPRPPLYEHEAYLKHFYDTRSSTPTYDELLQLAKKLGDSMYNIDAWYVSPVTTYPLRC